MSAYDYLTGNVVDPYDNVGKVRKFGHRNPGTNNPNNHQSSIQDLLAQDIYITSGTPGPLPSSKANDQQPLTLPPILKGSLSNANIYSGNNIGSL